MKVDVYTEKTKETGSNVENTYDAQNGKKESTTYHGSYGSTATFGTEGANFATVGMGPLSVGFDEQGGYKVDVSIPVGGDTHLGASVDLNPSEIVAETANGLEKAAKAFFSAFANKSNGGIAPSGAQQLERELEFVP